MDEAVVGGYTSAGGHQSVSILIRKVIAELIDQIITILYDPSNG